MGKAQRAQPAQLALNPLRLPRGSWGPAQMNPGVLHSLFDVTPRFVMTADNNTMRADKWLWAARFYKTRTLAIQAINGGKVHVSGERIKPARRLSVGEDLTIRKGPYLFAITVEMLNTQRRPATEARQMYSESEASVHARQILHEELKLQGHGARHRERRPDKRTRGKIRQMKIKQSQ